MFPISKVPLEKGKYYWQNNYFNINSTVDRYYVTWYISSSIRRVKSSLIVLCISLYFIDNKIVHFKKK